jgi:O-acetyl-ADP-ribose deacetylase (regulator of RNase III)
MPGKLKYIKGDLFTSQRPVIAHGCNCRGAFGSGVAGQIAQLYPEALQASIDKFRLKGWKLGDIQYVDLPVDPPLTIVNMATQDTYGRQGVHVNYDALRACFTQVLAYCQDSKLGLAIPKVGAGLAGGDWGKIEDILVSLLGQYDVEVDVYCLD